MSDAPYRVIDYECGGSTTVHQEPMAGKATIFHGIVKCGLIITHVRNDPESIWEYSCPVCKAKKIN